MNELWYQIGIRPAGVVGVVLASIAIYLVFTLVVRVGWRHFGASRSSFGLALVTVLGAVLGRAMLGNSPTLAGGLLALVTLLALEGAVGLVRRSARFADFGRLNGAIVMTGDDIDQAELRSLGVTERDLWINLRRAGIRQTSEVGVVIVELDGRFTVIRSGTTVDRRIMAGVRGAGDLPATFYEPRTVQS